MTFPQQRVYCAGLYRRQGAVQMTQIEWEKRFKAHCDNKELVAVLQRIQRPIEGVTITSQEEQQYLCKMRDGIVCCYDNCLLWREI